MRGHLADEYRKHKEQLSRIKELEKQVESLTDLKIETEKKAESLSKELGIYVAREEEAKEALRVKRLEKLSRAFESLGQSKSVD